MAKKEKLEKGSGKGDLCSSKPMFKRCIYFNTNALVRTLNSRWDAAFSDLGLAPSHGYLLRAVLEQPGMTQTQLTEILQLDKSTITRFLNKLEAEGWLSREASTRNLREKTVHASPKTLALASKFEALSDSLYQEMCEGIGKDTLKRLVKTLRTVNTSLRQP